MDTKGEKAAKIFKLSMKNSFKKEIERRKFFYTPRKNRDCFYVYRNVVEQQIKRFRIRFEFTTRKDNNVYRNARRLNFNNVESSNLSDFLKRIISVYKMHEPKHLDNTEFSDKVVMLELSGVNGQTVEKVNQREISCERAQSILTKNLNSLEAELCNISNNDENIKIISKIERTLWKISGMISEYGDLCTALGAEKRELELVNDLIIVLKFIQTKHEKKDQTTLFDEAGEMADKFADKVACMLNQCYTFIEKQPKSTPVNQIRLSSTPKPAPRKLRNHNSSLKEMDVSPNSCSNESRSSLWNFSESTKSNSEQAGSVFTEILYEPFCSQKQDTGTPYVVATRICRTCRRLSKLQISSSQPILHGNKRKCKQTTFLNIPYICDSCHRNSYYQQPVQKSKSESFLSDTETKTINCYHSQTKNGFCLRLVDAIIFVIVMFLVAVVFFGVLTKSFSGVFHTSFIKQCYSIEELFWAYVTLRHYGTPSW